MIDFGQLLFTEGQVLDRSRCVIQLSHTACAHQRRRDSGIPQCPGHGHLRQRLSPTPRDEIQSAYTLEIVVREHRGEQRLILGRA